MPERGIEKAWSGRKGFKSADLIISIWSSKKFHKKTFRFSPAEITNKPKAL